MMSFCSIRVFVSSLVLVVLQSLLKNVSGSPTCFCDYDSLEELVDKCNTHSGDKWCMNIPGYDITDAVLIPTAFAWNEVNLLDWEETLPPDSARSCSDPSAWAPGIALGSYNNGPRVFAQLDHNPSPQNNDAMCFLSLTMDDGDEDTPTSLYKFGDLTAAQVSGCHTDLISTCNELGIWGP